MSIKAAYVLPHPPLAIHEVGQGREYEIKDTLNAFKTAAEDMAAIKPDTCVMISPHSIIYSDYFHISPGSGAKGSMASFGAPQVRFSTDYDTELVKAITRECDKRGFPAGIEGQRDASLDHGTMVPMYFIDRALESYMTVRIGFSGLSLEEHYRFGKIIKTACESIERDVVIVASGDLSHCQKEDGPYGYRPEGPKYDERLMRVLASGNLRELLAFKESLLEGSMECGHRSFCIMAGAFDGQSVEARNLSHEATFGVGYGISIIKPAAEMQPG